MMLMHIGRSLCVDCCRHGVGLCKAYSITFLTILSPETYYPNQGRIQSLSLGGEPMSSAPPLPSHQPPIPPLPPSLPCPFPSLPSRPSFLRRFYHQHPAFLQAGCPSCRPTNGVKALKGGGVLTIELYQFDGL